MNKDELLARELAKLGKAAAGSGGAAGAGLAARFLPTETHRLELRLRAAPAAALGAVFRFIAEAGGVVEPEAAGASPFPAVAGVVGSGFWRMNPTLVVAEVVAVDGDACVLAVTAAAKEGLIRQNSARKAVDRLAAALRPFAC